MPAKSESQRKLMGIALSIKRGETPRSYSAEAASIADSMTLTQLEEYAKSPPKEQLKVKGKAVYQKKGNRWVNKKQTSSPENAKKAMAMMSEKEMEGMHWEMHKK